MGSYTDDSLKMRIEDIWIFSDAILVPKEGWITGVSGSIEFCGLDSRGESIYQSEVRYLPDRILIHDASYSGKLSAHFLDDLDLLNTYYRGKMMYLQFDAWAVLSDIQTASGDHDQRFPTDYIRFTSGTITFTYEDYSGGTSTVTKQISFGGSYIKDIYLGSIQPKAVYLGENLVWEPTPPIEPETKITYTYNPNYMEITVNLTDIDEKMQNRLDEGRLYLSIYAKDRQAQSKITCFGDGHSATPREELDWCFDGNIRSKYKRMNKLIYREKITSNPFTVCFDEFSFMDLHATRRFVDYEGSYPEFIKFQAALHFYSRQSAEYFDAIGTFSEAGPLRMVPNSLSKMFNYNTNGDNNEYGIYIYEDTNVWSRCDGFNILFDQIVKLPSNETGIGVQDLSFYCKFNDDYGRSKTYSSAKLYWIPATASFTTSNMKAISEATPIPANTNVKIVAYCSSGHIEDLIEARMQATFTTKIN